MIRKCVSSSIAVAFIVNLRMQEDSLVVCVDGKHSSAQADECGQVEEVSQCSVLCS